MRDEIERMLTLQIIQPSKSAWGAPCILVRKPPEKGKPVPHRFVVDYRSLNEITVSDGYPIPTVQNILDFLCPGSGKYFAKLDLASGYWQVRLNPADRHKTAFCTQLGLWEFLSLPMGLKTSSNTFQRILNTVFSDFLYQFVIIYVDDIICWSDSQEQALKHCEKILSRASDYGVQLKLTKCKFFATTVDILGHQITPDGRRPTSKGIEAIINLPSPKNTTELKKFLGMVGFLREYIRNMSTRTLHFRSLLKKGVRFQWDEVHEAEFNDLKQAITSPDILLSHPRFDLEF